MKLRTTTYYDF